MVGRGFRFEEHDANNDDCPNGFAIGTLSPAATKGSHLQPHKRSCTASPPHWGRSLGDVVMRHV